MPRFSLSRLALIVIRYRGLLAATFIAVIVTLILDGSHRGVLVLVANRELAAGTTVTAEDFTPVFLDGGDPNLYVSTLNETETQTIGSPITAGQPLLLTQLTKFAPQIDQMVVQIPLEAGNPASFASGSVVHVWSLGDEFVSLVCSDARVLETYVLNGSAWVTLSIPRVDEAAVMQSGSVRLAVV